MFYSRGRLFLFGLAQQNKAVDHVGLEKYFEKVAFCVGSFPGFTVGVAWIGASAFRKHSSLFIDGNYN